MSINQRSTDRIHPVRQVVLLAVLILSCAAVAAQTEDEPVSALSMGTAGPGVLVLSLEDCIATALKQNLDIQVARFNPLKRDNDIMLAWGAFDSQFYLNARNSEEDRLSYYGYQLQGTETTRFLTSGISKGFVTGGNASIDISGYTIASEQFAAAFPYTQNSYFADVSLTVTQPLLKNFGVDLNKRGIYIAQNNLEISREQFRYEVIQTLSGVQKAYWDLAYSIKFLEVQEKSLQRAQDLYDLNKTKVEVGALPPIEITTAEAEVAIREVAIISATNQIRAAKDSLRQALNLPGDSQDWERDIQPQDLPEFEPVLVDWQQCLAEALAARPDLRQARLDLDNRAIDMYFYKNQLRPELNLQAGYGRSGLDNDDFEFDVDETGEVTGARKVYSGGLGEAIKGIFDGQLTNWYLSANLVVPLQRRRDKANYATSELAKEEAGIILRRLEQQVAVEVREAVRTLETRAEQVVATNKAWELAGESLAAEQKKFENGLSTSYNVILKQEDLALRANELLSVFIDYNKTLLDLEAAKGTLLDYLGIELVEMD